MATPTWPVPYYQGAFRAEANLNVKTGDLNHIAVPLQAAHAMTAGGSVLSVYGRGFGTASPVGLYDATGSHEIKKDVNRN